MQMTHTTTIAASDIEDLITMTKEELSNISDWLRVNRLRTNPSETEYMVKGRSVF